MIKYISVRSVAIHYIVLDRYSEINTMSVMDLFLVATLPIDELHSCKYLL